jgi:putative membrane protein
MLRRLLLVALGTVVGCSDTSDGSRSSQSTVRLSDAQLITMLVTANQTEIAAAQLALMRATDSATQQLAARMIAEHTIALEREQSLLGGLGLTPAASDATTRLQNDAAAAMRELQAAPQGHAFDAAYTCAQVRAHLTLLQLLAGTADSARVEVRDEVEQVRATATDHLAHASRIAASLGVSRSSACSPTGAAGPPVDAGAPTVSGSGAY